MKNNYVAIALFIALLLGGVFFASTNLRPKLITNPSPSPTVDNTIQPSPSQVLGVRTKNTNCQAQNSLPDKDCTPGSIDSRVTQQNIGQTICVPGYTKTVRPPVSFTNPLKLKLMQQYSDADLPQNYELDHLISLELGGDPTSEANLWPEAYSPTPGAHEKDKVENYLHSQVCNGSITLQQAQLEISQNWLEIYNQIAQ